MAGCRAREEGAPGGAPGSAPEAKSVAPPEVTSAPKAETVPALPVLAARKVPERALADGSTLYEFTFEREAEDEGLVWLDAAARCVDKGMHLCTSTQWQAACDADPAVAAVETWTMTPAEGSGFVVRGGASSCRAKRAAHGAQASPFRAGACCSPSIAASAAGGGISAPNLRAMARRVLALEKAMGTRRGSAVRDMLDDPLQFFLAKKSRDEVVAQLDDLYKRTPDFQAVHEVCDFSVNAADETFAADCRKIGVQKGTVGHVLTRYVFVGGSGKLRSMTDPQVFRPFAPP
jgi:hypothetical protein